MIARKPSLRLQLLFRLVFLASTAVVLTGLVTLVLAGVDPTDLLAPLAGFWIGSTAVFVLFGVYLMNRYVLAPLERLAGEAEEYEGGKLGRQEGGKNSTVFSKEDRRAVGSAGGPTNTCWLKSARHRDVEHKIF